MCKWITPTAQFERLNAFTNIFASPENLQSQANYNTSTAGSIWQQSQVGAPIYANGNLVAYGTYFGCNVVHSHKTVPNAYWCDYYA